MSTTRVQLIDKNTTVGTAAAEDTKIVFDGNAQDYQDSSIYYYIEMNTSNRPYYNLSSIDQAVGSSSGQYYFTLSASALADMDANDTVTCRVVMGGSSGTGPSDISANSHFSGFLVC
jgi:hypothetical protein